MLSMDDSTFCLHVHFIQNITGKHFAHLNPKSLYTKPIFHEIKKII